MSTSSLLHELLLSLVGHLGDCVEAVVDVDREKTQTQTETEKSEGERYTVIGIELIDEIRISPAERTAINTLLRCGYHYASILHFTQSVDEGATLDSYRMPTPTDLHSVASNVAELRRLDAQQARSVYSAGSQMLSPVKARRPTAHTATTTAVTATSEESTALVPVNKQIHPLIEDTQPQKGRTQNNNSTTCNNHLSLSDTQSRFFLARVCSSFCF